MPELSEQASKQADDDAGRDNGGRATIAAGVGGEFAEVRSEDGINYQGCI
jgi:hypothetical protein